MAGFSSEGNTYHVFLTWRHQPWRLDRAEDAEFTVIEIEVIIEAMKVDYANLIYCASYLGF